MCFSTIINFRQFNRNFSYILMMGRKIMILHHNILKGTFYFTLDYFETIYIEAILKHDIVHYCIQDSLNHFLQRTHTVSNVMCNQCVHTNLTLTSSNRTHTQNASTRNRKRKLSTNYVTQIRLSSSSTTICADDFPLAQVITRFLLFKRRRAP